MRDETALVECGASSLPLRRAQRVALSSRTLQRVRCVDVATVAVAASMRGKVWTVAKNLEIKREQISRQHHIREETSFNMLDPCSKLILVVWVLSK